MKFFKTEQEAMECVKRRNQAFVKYHKNETFCMVDGPDNDFCVMTVVEAIENEFSYKWTV
jgi:hypothetical protein